MPVNVTKPAKNPHDALTPEALAMLQTIVETGSFASAARKLGLVPSALTYRVRQLEDALDVLLFDRSARQARPTAAGSELLHEGKRILDEMDAIASRIKRIATGWEAELTIAVDTIISPAVIMELCEAFLATQPPTRLRLRDEALSGSLQALGSGLADLAIGIPSKALLLDQGIRHQPLGSVKFIFVIAPHHPLAQLAEPISPAEITRHRVVSVADSIQRGSGVTIGVAPGQDVLTVPSMTAKLDAQVRGLGCGFVPEPLARPLIASGRLVVRQVAQPERQVDSRYAWRQSDAIPGRALQWWLHQLGLPATREALLAHHRTI